jgi:hypothetical protein
MQSYIEQSRREELLDSSFDEFFFSMVWDDDTGAPVQHGGSRPGRSANIDRNRVHGARQIYDDYFSTTPTYGPELFRRRFRMNRQLFLRIAAGVQKFDNYFTQMMDALKLPGLSPLQKITAAMRILSNGIAADLTDEYVRIGESTALKCLYRFCDAVIAVFGEEYLRSPTVDDLKRILAENERRGWPGMIGSLDCYAWPWKNCPKGLQGIHKGAKGTSIVLEAAVSYDLWFWHSYFGLPGSLNDINIVHRSPLMHELVNGTAHQVAFTVNNTVHHLPYWLADGIYPRWPVFVKTIADPQGAARKLFAERQESTRKDVERAFGVLQSRFAIVKNPGRQWSSARLHSIMNTCIILHNMICENERHDYQGAGNVNLGRLDRPGDEPSCILHVSQGLDTASVDSSISALFGRMETTRDLEQHLQLRDDLVQHLWNEKGAQ